MNTTSTDAAKREDQQRRVATALFARRRHDHICEIVRLSFDADDFGAGMGQHPPGYLIADAGVEGNQH